MPTTQKKQPLIKIEEEFKDKDKKAITKQINKKTTLAKPKSNTYTIYS